jgi:hypothetical protein
MRIQDGLIPAMVAGDDDRTNCPTCGMPVMIYRRVNGYADHYDMMYDSGQLGAILQPQDPKTAAKLREERRGKKTVAMVGLAPTSCSLAPFEEEDCEIWCLNEMHAFPWMKRATRWFQIHDSDSWKRYIAKRDVRGHYDWLKRNPLDIPIYMQYQSDLVPRSIGYPLHDVVDMVFKNFWRGEAKVKYFTSTLAYEMGIAILEGFERIEIYGFEMADEIEYVKQKACAEFWIGNALGRGIEVYTPPNCQILYSALYGGSEQGAGW